MNDGPLTAVPDHSLFVIHDCVVLHPVVYLLQNIPSHNALGQRQLSYGQI